MKTKLIVIASIVILFIYLLYSKSRESMTDFNNMEKIISDIVIFFYNNERPYYIDYVNLLKAAGNKKKELFKLDTFKKFESLTKIGELNSQEVKKLAF